MAYSNALKLNGNDGWLWDRRGITYAQKGEWAKADDDFERAIQLRMDDASLWRRHALVRLARDDTDAYRNTCASLFERCRKTFDSVTANRVAWTCVMAPDAVPDPAGLVQMAERAVENNPGRPDELTALGAALYRAGRTEAAINRLNEATNTSLNRGTAWQWLFLSMAHHRLGRTAEAHEWLARAARWIDQTGQAGPKDAARAPLSWDQRLQLQLLRREAEELLKEGKR